jgi:hypothetical protein
MLNSPTPAALMEAPATTLAALSIIGLEQVYDRLAAAIDQAGPTRSELFLVKLALLNAQALGDAALGGLNFEVQHRTTCKVLHKWEPTTRT